MECRKVLYECLNGCKLYKGDYIYIYNCGAIFCEKCAPYNAVDDLRFVVAKAKLEIYDEK